MEKIDDIKAYLKEHENKQLLRFITCGNVDDGKSTLIGRLLHDSKGIFEDQLENIKKDSKKNNSTDNEFDLSLLVDGLQSEREQGITIDVAYRYFTTPKRKFIIADTPGHEQYTRNMATGASTANLAIILIDARYGVQTQTKRHSFINKLLGIKHIVVAVNKMDLMDFREDVFNKIKEDYLKFAKELGLSSNITLIPLSALNGDNVVERSSKSPWYKGETLIEHLENVQIDSDRDLTHFRFPVQYVNRANLDFRGFCGTVASGVVKVGDKITVLPSHKSSKVKEIVTYDGNLPYAYAQQAITLTLEDEIDISRGDVIVKSDEQADEANNFDVDIVWLSEDPLIKGKQYFIKRATTTTVGTISQFYYKTDVNTLERSSKSPWYKGETLIEHLENVQIDSDRDLTHFRFPVQYVNRANLDFRGFCGTVASGVIKVGDEITVLPSKKSSKVKEIVTYDGNLSYAYAQQAITLTLEDEIDISRGDVIVKSDEQADEANNFDVDIVWLSEDPLIKGKQYFIKRATSTTVGTISQFYYKTDVNTLERSATNTLNLNEIARAKLDLEQIIAYDTYDKIKTMGSFIIIDRVTNNTVGAGMIRSKSSDQSKKDSSYSAFEIEFNSLVRKHFPHWECKEIF